MLTLTQTEHGTEKMKDGRRERERERERESGARISKSPGIYQPTQSAA